MAGQPLSLNQVKSPEFLEAAEHGAACGTLGYRSFINYPAVLLSFGFLICKMEAINLLCQESVRVKLKNMGERTRHFFFFGCAAFIAVCGLSLAAALGGYSLFAVRRLLIAVASLAERVLLGAWAR